MFRDEALRHIEPLLRTVERASRSLLMLDYDGTLAPFHSERHQAFPYPGVTNLLQQLVRCDRTRMVIVSGRDSREIVPLLGVDPTPEIWGLHGLQRRQANGAVETAQVATRTMDALGDAQRWLDYQELKGMAEFKVGSIAVHWRGMNEDRKEEIRSRVLLGWKPIADHNGLSLLHFDGGVEIRPAETNKGDVVRKLVGEMGSDTASAYLGDDSTDEEAFRAIQGRGLSVLVRSRQRPTTAQVWLKPPEELLLFLGQWLQACRGTRNAETRLAVTQ